MTGTESYYRRKAKGICVQCGVNKALPGKVACKACAEKQRIQSAERREWLKNAKICPQCGQTELYGDEKICPECAARKYESNLKSKKKTGASTANTYAKNAYAKRKADGICVKCGKRKAENGKTRCAICNALERERQVDYKTRKQDCYIPRYERTSYGLCYFCGSPVEPGRKKCGKCNAYNEKAKKQHKKPCASHIWRRMEDQRIKGVIRKRGG